MSDSQTYSRRHALQAGLAALPLAGTLAHAASHSLGAIGVQLYTVRDVISKDPAGTLKQLEEIGYREAEVIRGNMDQIWAALTQTKLKPVSLHMDYALFAPSKTEELRAAIEDAKKRGFAYIVCPYVPPGERGGLATMRQLAKNLSAAGEECRKAGLQLCYHNHAFEFEPMESTTPLEVLLKETSKDLVHLELDIFWASVAGHNPVDLLRKYSGRIPLVHLKNKAPDLPVQYNEKVPKTAFREVGNGTLDVPAILRAAARGGVKHYFVEQDATPGDPVASLRQSYEYLHRLRF